MSSEAARLKALPETKPDLSLIHLRAGEFWWRRLRCHLSFVESLSVLGG